MTRYVGRSRDRLTRARERLRAGWRVSQLAEPEPAPNTSAGPVPQSVEPLGRRSFVRLAAAAGTAGLATALVPSVLRETAFRAPPRPSLFETPRSFEASPEIALPRPERPVIKGPALVTRQLALLNENTGERVDASYWADGDYVLEELELIYRVLRDHHAEEMYAIDLDLVELLHGLGDKLETREPFHILSAYRTPRTNAMLAARYDSVANNSFHLRGMAVDLHMPGRRKRDLLKAAVALKGGGVGNYRTYVHLDTGPRRHW